MAARHPFFISNIFAANVSQLICREKNALPGFAHQVEVVQSMSQRSNCYDNAHAKSCWSRLKTRTAR
jgi:transposase InsO family protein